MSVTPVVERISLYPIKSLDPVLVSTARILSSGALEHDREFALFDEQGTIVNGKRNPRIHKIRAGFYLPDLLVALWSAEAPGSQTFHLIDQRAEIEDWLGNFLGLKVSLQRNTEVGFPDDLDSPGPTIVSTATLREVGSWFGITDTRQISRRFRANIEIATDEPFWEDRLFGNAETPVEFLIGDVRILGINPCQRCAVPSRSPTTGEALPDFQRLFSERREKMLPPWAERSRFNHYYRLTVNTRIPKTEAGKELSLRERVARSTG
jgi:hypothetical protein